MKKVLLLCLLAVPVFVIGQLRMLDPTFGNGGAVLNKAMPINISSSAMQTNGKIIVGGGIYDTIRYAFSLIRYNIDGDVDLSFGNNGQVIEQINPGTEDRFSTMALQADGKILVAGSTKIYPNTGKSDVVVMRFDSTGKIDSSFATNGFSVVSYLDTTDSYDQAFALLIRSNGKIIVAGQSSGPSPFGYVKSYDTYIQFDVNGKIDSSFGINGKVMTFTNNSDLSVALQNDGKLIAGGKYTLIYPSPYISFDIFSIIRYNQNGKIDSTYGVNGMSDTLSLFNGNSVSIQPDGKVLFAGYDNSFGYYMVIARFDSTGKKDTTFGKHGLSNLLYSTNGSLTFADKIMAQPNGKMMVVGTYNKDFLLMRLKNNGERDSSFCNRGLVTIDLKGQDRDEANNMVVQPSGKMVLIGFSGYDTSALARIGEDTFSNYLHGSVFLDANLNGVKDATEQLFHDVSLTVAKQGSSSLYSSQNGHFDIDLDTGTYVSSVSTMLPYYTSAPASHITNNTTYNNIDSFLFAMQPIQGKRDLSIHLHPYTFARPGFPLQYLMKVRNVGTDTANNVVIKLIKSNKVNFNTASSLPGSVNNDTIKWIITSFLPQQNSSILIDFTVKASPAANIGDTLQFTATISSNKPDLTPADDTINIHQIVGGSFDPNDKTENHGGRITNTQVANGDYLQYTIRFQNTGNDTAFNVYIHDTLSNKLDYSTMQIITSSHNYQMTMSDGKCLFKFPGINLVDSIHNEPGSHGYIVYKVKPLPTVQVGDIIKNTAAIYFDYNLPIYTNTEMTTVVAETFPLKLLTFTARKQDKSNLLNWTTANEINVDHFDIERSGNSREFSKIGSVKAGINNYSYTDNNPTTTPNPIAIGTKPQTIFYRLKMIDKDGQFTYSPVRKLNNSETFSVSIYPNPAKDNLQIQIDSYKKTAMQLQVLSMDGKVILSNSVTVAEGSILQSINITALVNGSYFLKAITTDKDEQVVKFEKL